MTRLLPGKPLIRETAAFEHTEPIVVALHPKHLVIKLKGSRESIDLDYDDILAYGRRLRAAYSRAAR